MKIYDVLIRPIYQRILKDNKHSKHAGAFNKDTVYLLYIKSQLFNLTGEFGIP